MFLVFPKHHARCHKLRSEMKRKTVLMFSFGSWTQFVIIYRLKNACKTLIQEKHDDIYELIKCCDEKHMEYLEGRDFLRTFHERKKLIPL